MALVGVLYNRLNKDREGQQEQLDNGQETFILIRERLTAVETKCGACEGIDKKDTAEILRISSELSRLHDDVVRLMARAHGNGDFPVSSGSNGP
jgi:hypothetical protein